MSHGIRSSWRAFFGAASLLLLIANVAAATPIYQEVGGIAVGEGELYSRRAAGGDGKTWKIAPTEVVNPADNAQPIANARGGQYVQVLRDDNVATGGPLLTPSIEYDVQIATTGTYRLYVRWEGNSNSFLSSDSFFADLVQAKDGTTPAIGTGTNQIVDWYELFQNLDGDFSTSAWDGQGGREENVATPGDSNMSWFVSSPGLYTLRFSAREDGAALDAWVFQLSSLAAPAGDGPPVSALVPEPGTAALLGSGLLGLRLHRRRRQNEAPARRCSC